MPNPAAIRLGTTGKAQVKADFAEVARSGTASFARIGDAGDAQAKRWGKAYDSASRDAEAAMVRLSTARTKLDLLMPGLNPTKLDAYAGVSDQVGKAAGESAGVFEAAFARMDRAAAALVAKYDPLIAAQQRHDEELGRAKILFDAGSLSVERYEQIQRSLTATLAEQRRVADDRAAAIQRASAATLETAAGARPAAPTKTASDSGAVFEQYFERMDQRARALVSAFDPLIAAQQRYDEGLREARALLDAGSLSTENYERVQRSLTATLNDQRRAADDRAAAVQRASAATLEGAAGVRSGPPTTSAADSASVFEDYYARLEQRTRALVAAIDPAFAAQDRFNREMAEARELVSAGVLSLDQYVAKLRVEQGALDVATAAKRRANVSTGELRAGSQQLSYQIGDVTASLASGSSITTVFAQQIGQTVQAVQLMTGATSGFLGFMAGPWGAVVTGGIVLLTMLAGKYLESGDAAEKAEAGMKKFQDRQSDIGNFIDATTGKLKEQNKTLILNAILTRQAQIADNDKAIADQRKTAFRIAGNQQTRSPTYTSSTAGAPIAIRETDPDVQRAIRAAGGDVDKLATSIARLASTRRPDLKDLALDLSNQAGQAIFATQENAKLRKELAALGGDTTALMKVDTGLIDARAKLAGATTAMGRAQAQYTIATREADAAFEGSKKTAADQQRLLAARTKAEHDLAVAQDANKKGGQAHEASLRRQADAMTVNASASLDLARAYLAGGDAALRAEAARKGLTDATRKGIDVDAQTSRQLQVMIGEQVATGAKSVAQLRDEADARRGILAQVAAGTLPVESMNRALSDEAALRPLLTLQTLAQGDALTVLTQVIDQYRAALKDAHEQETNFGLEKAIDDSLFRVGELKASISEMKLAPLDAAANPAKRAAVREADAQGYVGPQRKTFIDSRVAEAEQQYYVNRARFIYDGIQGQEDALALAGRELQLVGSSDSVRSAELEKLRLVLDIRRRFPDMEQADIDARLRGIDALSHATDLLDRQKGAWQELEGVGANTIDRLFDPSSADSWGDRVKGVLGDIKSELLKLALINPLKNALFGQSNPTLGGVLGLLGKVGGLVGGASPAAAPKVGTTGLLSGYATGTEYASGGAAIVGENGPEIVSMPRGARVTPAAETRRMLGGNDNPPAPINHFHLEGAVVTQDLVDRMNAIGAGAAVRGAAGGAAMSAAEARAAGTRRLGRRW